jgi:uncharacterized C2H2 Zn-finger protein
MNVLLYDVLMFKIWRMYRKCQCYEESDLEIAVKCYRLHENFTVLIVCPRSSRLIASHGDFSRFFNEATVFHVLKHKPHIKSLSY